MNQVVIKNHRITDDIAKHLEQMILEGVFAVGKRLPAERKLAEQLKVSRPSLREALKKLAAKGLITSKQGHGNIVAEGVGQLFKDSLINLYEQFPET